MNRVVGLEKCINRRTANETKLRVSLSPASAISAFCLFPPSRSPFSPVSGNAAVFHFYPYSRFKRIYVNYFPAAFLLVYGALVASGGTGRRSMGERGGKRTSEKGWNEEEGARSRDAERNRAVQSLARARLDKISRERLSISSVFRFLFLFARSGALTRRHRRVITSGCKYFLIKPSRVALAFSARVSCPPDSAERSLSIDISDITCGGIATRSLMAFRGPPSLPASSASWYAAE